MDIFENNGAGQRVCVKLSNFLMAEIVLTPTRDTRRLGLKIDGF